MEVEFQHLQTLNTTNVHHIFEGLYEMRVPKVLGIFISVVNIVFTSPVIYFLIWYEKFESNHARSLVNQFVSSGCWTAFIYNVLGQTFEIGIALNKGPVSPVLCYPHAMLKIVLGMQYTWQAVSISVVKYLYIFVLKNPSGLHDDFWCQFHQHFTN